MTQQPDVEQEQMVDVGQGSDVYLESLNANGVNYVFINSGTDTFPIQESIAKYQSQGRRVRRSSSAWMKRWRCQRPMATTWCRASHRCCWCMWMLARCRWAVPSTTPSAGELAWSSAPGAPPTTFEGELPGGKSMNIHWAPRANRPRGWCASLHQVGLRDSQAGDHPAGDATGLPVGTLGASRPGLCQPCPVRC